jgi:hypothetical protein
MNVSRKQDYKSPNLDVATITNYHVVPTTNDEYAIEKVPRFRFLDVDVIELENLNKSGHKMNTHAKA